MARLLCSLMVVVSLLWASGLQVVPAMPALPQGAGDNGSSSLLLFPEHLLAAWHCAKGTHMAIITKAPIIII